MAFTVTGEIIDDADGSSVKFMVLKDGTYIQWGGTAEQLEARARYVYAMTQALGHTNYYVQED